MPVLLPSKESRDAWLADTAHFKPCILQEVQAPYGADDLVWHEVDPAMGSPKVQGPSCCKPIKRISAANFFAPRHSAGALAGASATAVAVKEAPAANELGRVGEDEPVAETRVVGGVPLRLKLLISCGSHTISLLPDSPCFTRRAAQQSRRL